MVVKKKLGKGKFFVNNQSRRFNIRWDKMFPTLQNMPYKLDLVTSSTTWFDILMIFHITSNDDRKWTPTRSAQLWRLLSKIYHPWKFVDSFLCSLWEKRWTRKKRKSAIFQSGSDVSNIRPKFFFSRLLPTIPENFMKIRPRVWKNRVRKKW